MAQLRTGPSPLAPLLDRLFEEAAAAVPATSPAVADLSAEERARLMRSKTEYLDFYGRLKDLPLPVSRETGTLLYMLARGVNVRNIVEFGTSFGISTLHLAAALRDNGGGHLITTEFEPSKVARARDNLTAGGLIDLVEIREGDALQTPLDAVRCACGQVAAMTDGIRLGSKAPKTWKSSPHGSGTAPCLGTTSAHQAIRQCFGEKPPSLD